MTGRDKSQRIATRCIHAGNTTDPVTGAVMPPIVTSTTFEYASFGEPREHIYARTSNPTRNALERCVAELESGVHALAYASGQAATAAVLDLLDAGDHVVAPVDFYGGSRRLLHDVRRRVAGLVTDFVDMRDPANVAAAVRAGTKLVWVETPTNPLLGIIDITAVAEVAHRHGALVCVDNTWASPYFQRPLELGADIVMHSATKYLGGHSDVLGGLNVVADGEIGKRLLSLRSASGGVMGPFDAYLVLRGIKTLALRMRQHEANARALAEFLVAQPKVEQVYYPGLENHPQHALATRQMDGYGAVVTCTIRGGRSAAARFISALRIFAIAESLGGVESLVGYPPTMSHSSVPEHDRIAMGIGDNVVRLSPGIEDAADLVADVEQALAAV